MLALTLPPNKLSSPSSTNWSTTKPSSRFETSVASNPAVRIEFKNEARTADAPGQTNLDLTITVPSSMTVEASHAVEHRVREELMSRRREIREVKIHVHAASRDEIGPRNGVIGSDFGRDGC